MGARLLIEGAVPSAGNEPCEVAYAECFCGATEAFDPSVGLPAGWRTDGLARRAWCPDCATATEIPAGSAAPPTLARLHDQDSRNPPLFVEIPPQAEQLTLIPREAASGGHHGFRLFHSHVARDSAVLRIHAGAAPVSGAPDRPVMALLRRADLREFIAALEAIDAEFEQAATGHEGGNN